MKRTIKFTLIMIAATSLIIAGCKENNAQEKKNILIKAKNGDAEAQYKIGMNHDKKEEYEKAIYWFKKSAENDYTKSQVQLGDMYKIKLDYQKAFKYYKKAALDGNSDAQNELGYLYQYGKGVSEDHQKAFRWYKKAADQGDANGLFNLGTFYHYGTGVKKDHKKALALYKKAAEKGQVFAQFNLAHLYNNKDNEIPKDTSKVKYWLKKAYKNPDADFRIKKGVKTFREKLETAQ